MVLKEVFKKEGFYNIEEAENGLEGFNKLEIFKPDLVISDIKMPQMDGFELCRKIRQHKNPQIARIPILIQTALKKLEDRDNIFRSGATDYITKPIDLNEITARGIIHLEREIVLRRLYNFNMSNEDASINIHEGLESNLWSFKRLSSTINILLDEIEQSQGDLRQAKEKAEKADQFKTEFLAYAAHELKTPVHCIVNFAQMGLVDCDKGNIPAVKEHLNDVYTNAKRLNVLLLDLMDISMMETGHIEINLKQCNIKTLLDNSIKMTRSIAEEKKITIEVEAMEQLENILVDSRRMEQVFTNLISNAIYFSPTGSKIIWKLKYTKMSIPQTDVSIPALSISIEDEGQGIPANNLERIFEPFVHDASMFSKGKSTGLGLTICRLILRLFHGTIHARNAIDKKGAVFEIMLPLQNKIGA